MPYVTIIQANFGRTCIAADFDRKSKVKYRVHLLCDRKARGSTLRRSDVTLTVGIVGCSSPATLTGPPLTMEPPTNTWPTSLGFAVSLMSYCRKQPVRMRPHPASKQVRGSLRLRIRSGLKARLPRTRVCIHLSLFCIRCEIGVRQSCGTSRGGHKERPKQIPLCLVLIYIKLAMKEKHDRTVENGNVKQRE